MEIDLDKIDDTVLALLWGRRCMTRGGPGRGSIGPLWIDCIRKGLIADPANKTKSVVLSDEGRRRAAELFHALFTRRAP